MTQSYGPILFNLPLASHLDQQIIDWTKQKEGKGKSLDDFLAEVGVAPEHHVSTLLSFVQDNANLREIPPLGLQKLKADAQAIVKEKIDSMSFGDRVKAFFKEPEEGVASRAIPNAIDRHNKERLRDLATIL